MLIEELQSRRRCLLASMCCDVSAMCDDVSVMYCDEQPCAATDRNVRRMNPDVGYVGLLCVSLFSVVH